MANFVTARAVPWLDGVQVSAQDLRLGENVFGMTPGSTGISARAGVRPSPSLNGLKIIQNTSPNMQVKLQSGMCLVQGTASGVPTAQGAWILVLTADTLLDVATAPASPNSRRDRVIAEVVDNTGPTSIYQFRVMTGTASNPTPAAPAVPDNCLDLGTFVVGSNVTSIVNANITDSRVFTAALGGVPIVPDASGLPANPYEGMMAFRRDIDTLVYWDGVTSWRGAWTAYTFSVTTPLATGTVALGSGGSASGRYRINGKTMHLHQELVVGSPNDLRYEKLCFSLPPGIVGSSSVREGIGVSRLYHPNIYSGGYTNWNGVAQVLAADSVVGMWYPANSAAPLSSTGYLKAADPTRTVGTGIPALSGEFTTDANTIVVNDIQFEIA